MSYHVSSVRPEVAMTDFLSAKVQCAFIDRDSSLAESSTALAFLLLVAWGSALWSNQGLYAFVARSTCGNGPYPTHTFITKEISHRRFALMSRRRSIPDAVRAGKNAIEPCRRGEDFRTRHARRLSANLDHEATVCRWYQQRGLTLRITNEGHHWQITGSFPGRMVALKRQTRDRQTL